MADAEPTAKRGIQWGIAIPVAIQALVFVFYAGSANQRLTALEGVVEKAETIPGRVLVLETRLAAIESQLGRVEDKVDRLLQRSRTASQP